MREKRRRRRHRVGLASSGRRVAPPWPRRMACLQRLAGTDHPAPKNGRRQILVLWFMQNGLQLNPDKSEALIMGTANQLRAACSLSSVKVAGVDLPVAEDSRYLESF